MDQTTWEPNGSGLRYQQVAPSDVNALASFLRVTGWKVIYGINLATNTPEAAASEALYVANALGTYLYGFEIGNECDQYSANGIRPPSYDLADFVAEWSQYAAAIRQSVPNAPLTGPASAANVVPWTVPFAASEGAEIKLLTQHRYRAGLIPPPTMAELVSVDTYLPVMLPELQAASTANGIPDGYRLSEANSFWSGGAANISNAFGSALWAIDFMLVSSQFGCSGVNFHGGGSGDNDPYYTPIWDTDAGITALMPIYYAMLFINQIVPGKMYEVNLTTSLNLTAYAVASENGDTYVVIVNKDPTTTAVTNINMAGLGNKAIPLVLAGGGLSTLGETTLGGSTVSVGGAWSAMPAALINYSGSISVDVAPASALLLRVF